MNLLARINAQSDAMTTVGVVANRMKEKDPEFDPICLTLRDTAKTSYRVSGPDIFKLTEQKKGGSRKAVKVVSIQKVSETAFKGWLEFAEHPETYEMYAFIPKTEHNMKWVASHLMDNFWDITPASIEKEAKKISETMTHIREPEKEHAIPTVMNAATPGSGGAEKELMESKVKVAGLESQLGAQQMNYANETLRKKMEEMQEELDQYKATEAGDGVVEPATQEKVAKSREEEIALAEKDPHKNLLDYTDKDRFNDDLKKQAKKIMLTEEKHVVWLAAHKERYPGKWWLHADYRRRLYDIREELKREYFKTGA